MSLNPKVYRRAAWDLLDVPSGCCYQILKACFGLGLGLDAEREHQEAFAAIFRPRGKSVGQYWFGKKFGSDKATDRRVLALLFMAEMVENGDV